jgi:hypothetical protein
MDAIRVTEPPPRVTHDGNPWPRRVALILVAILGALRLWAYWDEICSFDYFFGGVMKWLVHLLLTFAFVVVVAVLWCTSHDRIVSVGAASVLIVYFGVMITEQQIGRRIADEERIANEATTQDIVDRIWEYIVFVETPPDSLSDVGIEEPFYLHRGSMPIEVKYRRVNDVEFEVSYSRYAGGRNYYWSGNGKWEGQY